MNIEQTSLEGVIIIKHDIYEDQRGFFKETYQKNKFDEIGIKYDFVQDNFSFSNKNVIRGLHFQKSKPQGKLVWCPYGKVLDVVLDINPSSKTFRKYISVELQSNIPLSIWIPPGYAHGFSVLSDSAMFCYKCTDFYNPDDEFGVRWNDKDLNIDWGINDPIISSKDDSFPSLKEYYNL